MSALPVRAPYAQRLADRRALLDRAVARLCEICRSLGDVEAVYVYGSYARDEIRLRSDLDALVVRRTGERRAVRDTEIRLAFDLPVGLDLLVLTPDEYRDQLPTTSFGRTILATARRVDAS